MYDRAQFEREVAASQVAVARAKTYIGPAVLVLVLYLFFWFPGFIANILYYQDAKRNARIAGFSLPGTGCLGVLLWLNVASIVLGIIGTVVSLIVTGGCFLLPLLMEMQQ